VSTTRRPYAKRVPMAERRRQVLDAALKIIATGGYDAVSMEAVAREVGVTRPVVYGAFPSLPVLLAALVVREERRAVRVLSEIVPDELPYGVDPDDVLVDSMTRFLRAVAEHPNAWRLILLPIEGTPALLRREVRRRRANLLKELRGIVRWGLEHRGGLGGLDEDLLARAILSAGEQAARLLLSDPERWPAARLTGFARDLLGALRREA
jgi:AcrR family transcriptional regulator